MRVTQKLEEARRRRRCSEEIEQDIDGPGSFGEITLPTAISNVNGLCLNEQDENNPKKRETVESGDNSWIH